MAGISATFRFGAIKDLAKNFPDIVPSTERALERIGEDMADRGANMVRERMRVASGHGQRSVGVKVTGRQFSFGSPLIHVRVMDQGRRAGAAMPPKGALLSWMRRKGIPASDEYPIRRAISVKGIEGDHVFAKVRGELKNEVEERFVELRLDVLRALIDGVDVVS